MDLSKENPGYMNQQNGNNSELSELNTPTLTPLDGLLNLLVDLSIIDETRTIEVSSLPSDNDAIVVIEDRRNPPETSPMLLAPAKDITISEDNVDNLVTASRHSFTSQEPPIKSVVIQSEDSINSLDTEHLDNADTVLQGLQELLFGAEISNPQNQIIELEEELTHRENPQPDNLVTAIPSSSILLEKEEKAVVSEAEISINKPALAPLDNSGNAFDILQDILVGDELSIVQKQIGNLEQQLASFGNQMSDPQKLIDLLMPLIADILTRKVSVSREEIVQAIAPILDEMIEAKTREDKGAIASALAPVVSAAIAQQIINSPGEFATALAPEMGAAIKEQITLERDAMVDALYPVIGNTISKYMAEAIRSINDKVSNTFSVEGIKRKIRAKIQGVSEAELILREAMPFTVQAIFLIHKNSGLVISDVQHSGNQRLESEMVAGMLTAIRSFVNDCIAQSGEMSELNQIEYGNSKIILEAAGYCYLAVVIQGEPSQKFIEKMRQSLSTIVEVYGKTIKEFDGDPASIPDQVTARLKGLLDIPSQDKSTKPTTLLLVISLILGFILVPWGIYQYRHKIDHGIQADVTQALSSAPELAVYRLGVNAHQGTVKLTGQVPNQYLRQRAELIAQQAAVGQKLDNEIIAVEVPADPVLAAAEVKRVTAILNQLEGVSISTKYAAGKVTVAGKVSTLVDAGKITKALEQIPGVRSITNTVQLQPLTITTRIYFDYASAKLKPADAGDKINQVKAFLKRYPHAYLKIIGHSDSSGSLAENQQLAMERAKAVRDILVSEGIDSRRLQVAGIIQRPPDVDANQPLWLSRYVEFEPIKTVGKSK